MAGPAPPGQAERRPRTVPCAGSAMLVSSWARLFVCWCSHQQRPWIGPEAEGLVERIPRVGSWTAPSRCARPILVRAGPAGATHGSVAELDRWPRRLDQDPIEAGVTQAIVSAPGDQVDLHHAAGRRAASHRVNVAARLILGDVEPVADLSANKPLAKGPLAD